MELVLLQTESLLLGPRMSDAMACSCRTSAKREALKEESYHSAILLWAGAIIATLLAFLSP